MWHQLVMQEMFKNNCIYILVEFNVKASILHPLLLQYLFNNIFSVDLSTNHIAKYIHPSRFYENLGVKINVLINNPRGRKYSTWISHRYESLT